MSKKANGNKQAPTSSQRGITQITVSGFKSISDEQSIEIKPLTILAGANSSGKSSIMQPLLLLKQTLEATYDPGPLLINGPNVQFTSMDQLLSSVKDGQRTRNFSVGIGIGTQATLSLVMIHFKKSSPKGFDIQSMEISLSRKGKTASFHIGMTRKEIISNCRKLFESGSLMISILKDTKDLEIIRQRSFLTLNSTKYGITHAGTFLLYLIEPYISQVVHLPGLRGNPERSFPITAVSSNFPGTFQEYCASIIAKWQNEKNHSKLKQLSKYLERLGLTWKVTAKRINDAQVELQVGRLPHAAKGGARDLVNIADVGFGVSQTLPVLVALLVAEPGQLVYIEEPEIHLHPRAQSAMAQILADAAKRGVRVVIETHSQLLLLGIQTLVAEGKLSPELVKLHWFKRRNDGGTEISSTDLDEAGAFGDWPEDFAEVSLEAESRYLDAAESQQTIN
ncbi:MAG TPA: AAA family ATPase [Blastocatellia bacterium]|nr:AAA family ATPase [Blastocatellia bacterium]